MQQIHIQSEVNTQRQCFKASSDKRTQIKIAYHCGVSIIIEIAFTEAEEKEYYPTMKCLPIAVAFVSFCLITFHANPAFAAVIDAGAPPEDAVVVPLELKESDDATGKIVVSSVLYFCVVLFCFVLFCFFLSK